MPALPLRRRLQLGFSGLQRNPEYRRASPVARAWLGAKALRRMIWSGIGGLGYGGTYGAFAGGGIWGTLPQSQFNYLAEVGDPSLNSAVSICLGIYADNFSEPVMNVTRALTTDEETKRQKGGVAKNSRQAIPNHPLVNLIDRPNPFYNGDALWQATVVDYLVDGNAYWLKVRGSGGWGAPLQLWHVPYWQVRPRWDPDGTEFISHYDYIANGKVYRVEVGDLVHFRFGADPYSGGRLGWSRLKPILREIYSDNQIQIFTAALMRNMGCTPGMLSPKPYKADEQVAEIDPDAQEQLEREFESKFSGEKVGKLLMPLVPMEYTPIGVSPEDLQLNEIGDGPEYRISAALRVPAMVAGLRAGWRRATYANYQDARKAFYHEGLTPLQRRLAGDLDVMLLPELGGEPGDRVEWDYSQVQALLPDMGQITEQAARAYEAGIITRAAAKAKLGEPYDDADLVYSIANNRILVPADQMPETTEGGAAADQPAEELQRAGGKEKDEEDDGTDDDAGDDDGGGDDSKSVTFQPHPALREMVHEEIKACLTEERVAGKNGHLKAAEPAKEEAQAE